MRLFQENKHEHATSRHMKQIQVLNQKHHQSFTILNLIKSDSVLLRSLLKHVREEKSVGVAGRLFQHRTIRSQRKMFTGINTWVKG